MNFPSIPDSFYKVVLFLGLACVIFASYQVNGLNKDVEVYNSKIAVHEDSLLIKTLRVGYYRDKLLSDSRRFSELKGIKNPVWIEDSVLVYHFVLPTDSNARLINDSFHKLYDPLELADYEFRTQHAVLKQNLTDFKETLSYILQDIWLYSILLLFGLVLCVIGLVNFYKIQKVSDELLRRQLADRPQFYIRCQSCAKRFSSIIIRGTEANGEKSSAFCKECYQEGRFVDLDLKNNDVISSILHVKKISKKYKKRKVEKMVKALDRWRESPY